MSRVSINGLLKPKSTLDISNQYRGHFLKVSYIQEIAGHSVFGKDRVDVEEQGAFRFFLPPKETLSGESITIIIYAPDGEQLGQQIYSYGSLMASGASEYEDDKSEPMVIDIDPKIIVFNAGSPIEASSYKISGRLVDVSGEKKCGSNQVVIMATNVAGEASEEDYKAVFTSVTEKRGYFYGRVQNHSYEQAYALVPGFESDPIAIQLDDKKIPKELILMADLSELPDDRPCCAGTPSLPDASDLVGSSSFSQDLGGTCVDFTVPNRTLEEFSFYHTVRTTEPEIRGLTITSKESKNIKTELLDISNNLFTVFGRLRNSMQTMEVIPYAVDEEEEEKPMEMSRGAMATEENAKMQMATAFTFPVYKLTLASGTSQLKLNTKDLMLAKKGIDFSAILKLLAEQAKRQAKLKALHRKLSIAYCGKNGLQDEKTYCDTFAMENSSNKDSLSSLLGHIRKYSPFINKTRTLVKPFKQFTSDFEELLKQDYLDSGLVALMKARTTKLILEIDNSTPESQDQEELLGYLRRLVKELLEVAEKGANYFEPCPPAPKTDTMGIQCMMQEFDKTREMLRNKVVLSLGEILSIRASYDVYVTSIAAFLSLLEEFYRFHKSGLNILISLEDDYFIQNYNQVRSSLIMLKRQIFWAINKIENIEQAYITNHPGRRELTVENSIDWDETPTIYENTTIAHGHILHFKQMWKADGYSLGDLLYSLPLAPCQEKQLAIIDWDRAERARRDEAQSVEEALVAEISRDRDISEIMNSSFRENISASSSNKTSGTSAGIGGGIFGAIGNFVGGLFGGVSHSGASSRSTANQNSSRNLSGSTLNRLQDNISQSASSLRTQRNTVIQTVGQNETMSVQTEVVKNNNHCHAITIEYFEVLKHYAIEQKLVDIQECLFVPLPMSHFNHQKVLRWKNTLRRGIRSRSLQRGFDAIERIETNYADSDFPAETYADENIQEFRGNFSISFRLERPYIGEIEEATKTEVIDLNKYFPWFIGFMRFRLEREVPLTEQEKDALFEAEYAPEIVRSFIDQIEIYGIDEDGIEELLDLDVTLLSNYRRGAPLRVNIASRNVPEITRRQIKHLRFRASTTVKAGSQIILRSFYLYYKTQHLNEAIIRNSRVNNDIINTVEVQFNTAPFIRIHTDAALMYTPLSGKEQRNPRKEDREAATALVSFLNEHMEMSHKVIWASMDASRLFGLLDGYIAPNSGGKSVASVVENKIMGIVGNNIVLKVVPGERLDPVFRSVENLLDYYQPTTTPDPFRVSVPTKGVYAESVMGKCNSCEEIDDTRHWRFDEAPCGTKPTSIDSISTASRRSDVGDLQVKDMPANIVNMQNAPAAPDPTGLTAAMNLLGKSDAFGDRTGLAGTQANAIKALETTSKSVTDLAGMASDLKKQEAMKKDIGKTLKTIQSAEGKKQITKDQANELSYTALSSMAGKPTTKEPKLTQEKEVKDLIKAKTDKGDANIKINRGIESVEIEQPGTGSADTTFDYTVPGIVPIIAQPSNMTCWATVAAMMLAWKDQASYTIETAMDRAGASYRAKFDANEGLAAEDHEDFAAACDMEGEPSMSYTVSAIKNMIELHGPIIAIADEQPGELWAIHARVVTGIFGDGSRDGTFLRINDPAGGHQYTESFTSFSQKFEEVAGAPRLQIMHF